MENITNVNIKEFHPLPNHPFQVRDDDAMKETLESVREYGVLSPVTVRPRDKGGYEIIYGHRRTRACEIAGIEDIPVIIRNMDYDSAVIAMVDSNIQREEILPSEKAIACKKSRQYYFPHNCMLNFQHLFHFMHIPSPECFSTAETEHRHRTNCTHITY